MNVVLKVRNSLQRLPCAAKAVSCFTCGTDTTLSSDSCAEIRTGRVIDASFCMDLPNKSVTATQLYYDRVASESDCYSISNPSYCPYDGEDEREDHNNNDNDSLATQASRTKSGLQKSKHELSGIFEYPGNSFMDDSSYETFSPYGIPDDDTRSDAENSTRALPDNINKNNTCDKPEMPETYRNDRRDMTFNKIGLGIVGLVTDVVTSKASRTAGGAGGGASGARTIPTGRMNTSSGFRSNINDWNGPSQIIESREGSGLAKKKNCDGSGESQTRELPSFGKSREFRSFGSNRSQRSSLDDGSLYSLKPTFVTDDESLLGQSMQYSYITPTRSAEETEMETASAERAEFSSIYQSAIFFDGSHGLRSRDSSFDAAEYPTTTIASKPRDREGAPSSVRPRGFKGKRPSFPFLDNAGTVPGVSKQQHLRLVPP